MLLSGSPGLSSLVERRIEEAIARGEFDHLPGAGRALEPDIDPLVPEELRVACRVLRSAELLPAELHFVSEINLLLTAMTIAGADLDGSTRSDRSASARRLRALLIQLEVSGQTATARAAWQRYEEALAARLA